MQYNEISTFQSSGSLDLVNVGNGLSSPFTPINTWEKCSTLATAPLSGRMGNDGGGAAGDRNRYYYMPKEAKTRGLRDPPPITTQFRNKDVDAGRILRHSLKNAAQ